MYVFECSHKTHSVSDSLARIHVYGCVCVQMNVLIPGATDDDDLIESALPEQYKTKWDAASNKWITTTVSSSDY